MGFDILVSGPRLLEIFFFRKALHSLCTHKTAVDPARERTGRGEEARGIKMDGVNAPV